MKFVVLAQSEFGLRDAWYIDSDNIVDALEQLTIGDAARHVGTMDSLTILVGKEDRPTPYMFPADPDTDAELVLDFLRGNIRPVVLEYPMFYDILDDYNTRAAETVAAEAGKHANSLAVIHQFPRQNIEEQPSED